MIQKSLFGKIDEQEIFKFTFKNEENTQVSVINYGAIITEIITNDQFNQPSNIVLNYDTLEEYSKNPRYYGALVGRCANRISKGTFKLN